MAKNRPDRYPQGAVDAVGAEALDGGTRPRGHRSADRPTPTLKKSSARAERAPRPEPPTLKIFHACRGARSARAPRARPWRTAIVLVVLAAAVTTGVTFLRRHRGPLVESASLLLRKRPHQFRKRRRHRRPRAAPPPRRKRRRSPRARRHRATARVIPGRKPCPKPSSRSATSWNTGAPERGSARPGVRLRPPESRRSTPLAADRHAYAQLGWMSDSVERYQRAYRADPTCRGDPQMLEDLLKAVTHRVAGRNAEQAIRDIYGPRPFPRWRRRSRAGDRDDDDRLDHLRDSLAQ
jgi:hypothetical protein